MFLRDPPVLDGVPPVLGSFPPLLEELFSAETGHLACGTGLTALGKSRFFREVFDVN